MTQDDFLAEVPLLEDKQGEVDFQIVDELRLLVEEDE